MKLHEILVGVVFAVVVLSAFMGLMADSAVRYSGSATDYNESQLEEFTSSMDEITDISVRTKERIEQVRANPLIPDTLGSLVVGGIGGILTALESVDVFIDLSFLSVSWLPIGSLQGTLLAAITAAIIIVAFIGILAHYIRPSDRL